MLAASTQLGPYEIVAPLGAGGMGEVYRARDTRLGREVAVKVLPEAFAGSPDRQARFEREARAVAALSHPNILAIHDYGTQGGVTYAVMELLEGETLRSRLTKGPLPWREAVEIGAAVADGLAAAHAKGIIHRDLKPENLFLTADGRVKILDFGLARMDAPADPQAETGPYVPAATSPGVVMGTAGYMSPEQVRAQPVDARSDLFSFGCVLYEMLTGKRAFKRETAAETMTAILHDEPADPTSSGQLVPAELGRIIRQCLAKNPNQRLRSARDLALGLRATAGDPTLLRLPVGHRFSWRLLVITAAALLVGVIGASVYLLTRGGNRSNDGNPAEQAKAIESVAVLPFENEGGDPKTEPLSEGIPETVIHRLSRLRLPDLKVRSLLSVARYKGRKPNLEEIRRELGVGAVVTGRVQQTGGRLVVSVALTDVRDGTEIWCDEYDRKLDDILALQDRVAKDIAAHLRLRLTGDEEHRLVRRDTENSEACQLYLKGRFFWNKRTREGLEKAIECFRKATDADPNYALAYAGLADVYAVFPDNTDTRPIESIPKAKAAATKALELDDLLAEAHATLAFLTVFYEWNWTEGEKRFQRAIELNPNYATARKWYGQYLIDMGRFDEAEAQLKRAQELDPLSLMVNVSAGWCYFGAGRYDAAIGQCRKTLELDPDFWVAHLGLAEAYLEKGMFADALTELQTVRQPGNLWRLSLLGRAYALMGRPADAHTVIDDLKRLSQERYVPPVRVAVVYASLGEQSQALDWLEKAYAEQDGWLCELKVEPAYKGLHSEPRYRDLLRRMGLADKAAQRDTGTHSVAVLPFQNIGGDPKTEYLSDGVAEQIINNLSQVRRKDLIVRLFSSVARYRGKELDIQKFGRELNVQMIVTGTLRQDGDKLSISVEIADVEKESQIWGKRYADKPRDAILDLQDQIARDVAAKLRLELTGEEDKRLTKRYTEDAEAYLLFREADYHFQKVTPSGLETSIEYCRRALKKDPNYALAYMGLGRGYLVLGANFRGWRDTYDEAKKNLERARAIDKTLAGAHYGLGMLYLYHDWDWNAAKRELESGVELDPAVQGLYAYYLAAMNRPAEALATARRMQEFAPLTPNRWATIAQCHNWLRSYDRAIAAANRALELDPNFPLAYQELGNAYVQNGMAEKAIAELRQAVDRGQQSSLVRGMLGYAYATAGKRAEAKKVLDELEALAPDRFGIAFPIAQIHAALGEKDRAFKWLRKACDERYAGVIWLKVDPTLDSLRKELEFAQLLKDMGLPP
jgi:serine/threonine-protein kinase